MNNIFLGTEKIFLLEKNLLNVKDKKISLKVNDLINNGFNYSAAQFLAKGVYQSALLEGKSFSLSSLRGRAALYSGKYKASQKKLIERLIEYKIQFEVKENKLNILYFNQNILNHFKIKNRYKNVIKRICNF